MKNQPISIYFMLKSRKNATSQAKEGEPPFKSSFSNGNFGFIISRNYDLLIGQFQ